MMDRIKKTGFIPYQLNWKGRKIGQLDEMN